MQIDCTPALPRPPARLIDAVQADLPPILSDFRDAVAADNVAALLVKRGHCRAAAEWGIYEAIRAGRLSVGRAAVPMPQVAVRGPNGRVWSGGGNHFASIPAGLPAPFSSFTVTPTEALWECWRDGEATAAAEPPRPDRGSGADGPPSNQQTRVSPPYTRWRWKRWPKAVRSRTPPSGCAAGATPPSWRRNSARRSTRGLSNVPATGRERSLETETN